MRLALSSNCLSGKLVHTENLVAVMAATVLYDKGVRMLLTLGHTQFTFYLAILELSIQAPQTLTSILNIVETTARKVNCSRVL